METPAVTFTLAYVVFAVCFVFPPDEVRSAGLTVQSLLAAWLGSEDAAFVQYHLRRSTGTLLAHSLLPLGETRRENGGGGRGSRGGGRGGGSPSASSVGKASSGTCCAPGGAGGFPAAPARRGRARGGGLGYTTLLGNAVFQRLSGFFVAYTLSFASSGLQRSTCSYKGTAFDLTSEFRAASFSHRVLLKLSGIFQVFLFNLQIQIGFI